MVTQVVMPKFGLTADEATISAWLKREGDQVAAGEEIVEVVTEKANVAVEAPVGGFLRRIVVPDGQTAPVGTLLGYIAETLDEPLPSEEASGVPQEAEPGPVSAAHSATPPSLEPPAASRNPVSPAARRRAAELGVDLRRVSGSGPGGRITVDDVEAASGMRSAMEQPSTGGELSRRRRAIAVQMTRSGAIPQFHVTRDVDAGNLFARRDAANVSTVQHVTLTDLIVFTCAQELRNHVAVNAHYLEGDPPRLRTFATADIGLAVAADEGLIVPVLHDPAAHSLAEVAQMRSDAVQRAREGRLTEADLTGATFTISNLGGMGVDQFVALVDPPQVAILAVGRARSLVVQEPDGSLRARPHIFLTLSVDHRAADGAAAARFLEDLAHRLESPAPVA